MSKNDQQVKPTQLYIIPALLDLIGKERIEEILGAKIQEQGPSQIEGEENDE